ncbi:MAG TPA: DUF2784 domain-containing protein [Candidatus Binatia bacterium]
MLSLFFGPMNTLQIPYQLLADLIVLAHAAFVLFAVLGGLLVARWWRLVWIHLTTVIWAVLVEFFGWVCPLTPLENWLRQRGGQADYSSDFVAHYILPLLYPEGLTRGVQIGLGVFVILINGAIYTWIFRATRTAQNP